MNIKRRKESGMEASAIKEGKKSNVGSEERVKSKKRRKIWGKKRRCKKES